MSDKVKDVLDGALGYCWLWRNRVHSIADEDARAGFIRRHGSAIEVELLVEDVLAMNPFGSQDPVDAIACATSHSGALVLDIVSSQGGSLAFGGNRASVERYIARTLVISGEALEVTDHRFSEATLYFYNEDVLRWTGLNPRSQSTATHPGTNLVASASIQLGSTAAITTRLRPSGELFLQSYWKVDGDEPEASIIVQVGLEVGIRVARPRESVSLLQMLESVQVLLSAVFEGFVRAGLGRVDMPGLSERAFMWNSVLMPDEAPPRVQRLRKNRFPLVSFQQLGREKGIGRWIALTREHPRAVAPIHNRWRRGRGSSEQLLVECAVALEYWRAAHRRTHAWAKAKKEPPPLAAAKRIGSAFDSFVGDSEVWAKRYWTAYNGLKHDPSFAIDGTEAYLLAESGYVLLLCSMLDRVAGSKKPSSAICRGHQFKAFGDALRDELGTS